MNTNVRRASSCSPREIPAGGRLSNHQLTRLRVSQFLQAVDDAGSDSLVVGAGLNAALRLAARDVRKICPTLPSE